MRWKRIGLLLLFGVWICWSPLPAAADSYTVETVAGTDYVGDGERAESAYLGAVEGIARDRAGNIYIADNADHRVRRVDASTGLIETVAGTGHPGSAGDGGPGVEASLRFPYGVAVDPRGDVYIADFGNGRVRRIGTDGVIETVAGGGQRGDAVKPALAASLIGPRNVALDDRGNLYISDFADHRVYQVTPEGRIYTVAGTGVAGYTSPSLAVAANLSAPAGLAVTATGVLYIADSGNNCVRRVENGRISTVLGLDASRVQLSSPSGLTLDPSENLYVADAGNRRIVVLERGGNVRILEPVFHGTIPVRDVAYRSGLFASGARRVFWVGTSGEISLMAGSGEYGDNAEGIPAISARLDGPIGVAVDPEGHVYIAEEGSRRVRRVDGDGRIETVAGDGRQGNGGDGGPAKEASLIDPVAVAAGDSSRFWIADHLGHAIRRVGSDGAIETTAGDGTPGSAGDGELAETAQLNRPRGLALDALGNLFVADAGNQRVRMVTADGLVFTIAGVGVRGYSGDGELAATALLNNPSGVAVDRNGTVFIADTGNHVIRKVSANGLITRVAGDGTPGYRGDGGPASEARLNGPSGLAVSEDGALWIADTNNHRIRKISAAGIITTVAGTGAPGFRGDGGAADAALLRYPSDVALGRDGSVYVADLGNARIRRLVPLWTAPVEEQPGECRVLHGASFEAGPVAAGEIVAIFGEELGPESGIGGRLNASGVMNFELGNVVVRFNGVRAPLFYVDRRQVNAQVPYSIGEAGSAIVEVLHSGSVRGLATVAVAPAVPGVFTLEKGTGPAVALNADGSLNSADNPAARGSIVVLYATGAGLTAPAAESGRPATLPLPKPVLPVAVRIAGFPIEVLYAGAAPGFAGVMQLNLRLPAGMFPTGALPVELFVGARPSQPGVTLSVR